jgi:hypothetical protein
MIQTAKNASLSSNCDNYLLSNESKRVTSDLIPRQPSIGLANTTMNQTVEQNHASTFDASVDAFAYYNVESFNELNKSGLRSKASHKSVRLSNQNK